MNPPPVHRPAVHSPARPRQEGAALLLALVFLALFSLLGLSALRASTNEILMAGSLRHQAVAFYNAEAGIQHTLEVMEQGLEDKAFSLPQAEDTPVPLPIEEPPAGLDFQIEPGSFIRTGQNLYTFTSKGFGPQSAQARIRVLFKQETAPTLRYGVFGNRRVEFYATAAAYSYDSRCMGKPSRTDTAALTHKGSIASNESIVLGENAVIDGDVYLGEGIGGIQAWIWAADPSDNNISGEKGIEAGRMDPDPLGLRAGAYGARFNAPLADFDNQTDSLGSFLEIDGNLTLTGRSSGTEYLLTHFTLKTGAVLTVDVRYGPLTLYLVGPMLCEPGSTIEVLGSPADFTILCSTGDPLSIGAGCTVMGLVYAPYADVSLGMEAAVYGAIWSDTAALGDGATLFYDEQAAERYWIHTNRLTLCGWDEAFP